MSIYDQIANAGSSFRPGDALMKVWAASEQKRMNDERIRLQEENLAVRQQQQDRMEKADKINLNLKQQEFVQRAIPHIAMIGMEAERAYLEKNPGDIEGAEAAGHAAAAEVDKRYDAEWLDISGDESAVRDLTIDDYKQVKEQASLFQGKESKDEVIRLMQARDALPEDHPDRAILDSRINKLSKPAPFKATPSTVITPILAKLARGEKLTEGEQKALDVYQRSSESPMDRFFKQWEARQNNEEGDATDGEDGVSGTKSTTVAEWMDGFFGGWGKDEMTEAEEAAVFLNSIRGYPELIEEAGYKDFTEALEQYKKDYGDYPNIPSSRDEDGNIIPGIGYTVNANN